jgi:hypothetical protein
MEQGSGPPSAVSDRWQTFMQDTEATAEEYAEDGYETLVIHTGDVVPLPDEMALDVLAPGDEYRQLQSLSEQLSVDSVDVYAASAGDVEFALAVPLDEAAEIAVCVPVFFAAQTGEKFGAMAIDAGRVELHVRPLSDDSRVEFALEEPELLFEGV